MVHAQNAILKQLRLKIIITIDIEDYYNKGKEDLKEEIWEELD